jgi:hypothetical protein
LAAMAMKKLGLTIIFIQGLISCTPVTIPVADKSSYKTVDNKKTTYRYQIGEDADVIEYLFDLTYVDRDLLKAESIVVERNDDYIQISLSYKYKDYVKKFEYKKRDQELKCRTKVKMQGPLFPLLWGPYSESNSFCFDDKDNLVIYHNHGGALLLVAIPIGGASIGQIKGVYKKLAD